MQNSFDLILTLIMTGFKNKDQMGFATTISRLESANPEQV